MEMHIGNSFQICSWPLSDEQGSALTRSNDQHGLAGQIDAPIDPNTIRNGQLFAGKQ